MTLPVSGAISFNNINVELGVAGTTQASLGQSSYRTLAGVASGAISMSNFYGKSNRAAVSYTFSTNTANASLNLSTISGYTAGTSDITVTINAGVYLYSTSTGGYGLTLSGATTGDTVTIVNNGYIMGMGGTGSGWRPSNYFVGTAGGPAINIASIGITGLTITNTSGYIGGGGGGGGVPDGAGNPCGGGGGAGGGAGGGCSYGGPAAGGAGGSVGSSGSNGAQQSSRDKAGNYAYYGAGGGGGRIMPGTGGAGGYDTLAYGRGGGAGGGGGCLGSVAIGYTGAGGAGGSAGSAGSNGTTGPQFTGGGGGGWGASGGQGNIYGSYQSGFAGGKAINLGGKTVTWTGGSSSSSRAYGAVS